MLPLRAPRTPGAAVPRQPRAARAPAQRGRDPRRRRAAPSRVVLARLRGLAGADPAGPGPSRAARRDRIRVLAPRARRAARRPRRARHRRSPAASTPRFTPEADADRRPPRARAHQALRPLRRLPTARKNLPRSSPPLAPSDVEVVVAGGHRPQFAREAGLEALRHLGAVPERLLPGLYAGAEAFALPEPLRGLRPAGAGGDGVRDARRRRRRRRAAGDRAAAPPGSRRRTSEASRAVARAARRRRRAGAAARRRPATRAAEFTWDAHRRARWTRCCQRSSSRAAARYTRQRPRADDPVAAQPPQPRPVERVHRALAREPRVPERRARSSAACAPSPSSFSACFSRDAWPFSVVTKPCGPPVLPFDAGHDSSVSHTGLRASP